MSDIHTSLPPSFVSPAVYSEPAVASEETEQTEPINLEPSVTVSEEVVYADRLTEEVVYPYRLTKKNAIQCALVALSVLGFLVTYTLSRVGLNAPGKNDGPHPLNNHTDIPGSHNQTEIPFICPVILTKPNLGPAILMKPNLNQTESLKTEPTVIPEKEIKPLINRINITSVNQTKVNELKGRLNEIERNKAVVKEEIKKLSEGEGSVVKWIYPISDQKQISFCRKDGEVNFAIYDENDKIQSCPTGWKRKLVRQKTFEGDINLFKKFPSNFQLEDGKWEYVSSLKGKQMDKNGWKFVKDSEIDDVFKFKTRVTKEQFPALEIRAMVPNKNLNSDKIADRKRDYRILSGEIQTLKEELKEIYS